MRIPIGTLCTGIDAAAQAAQGTPFHSVFSSEIESFPCALLASRYPDVPNLGDMTKLHGADLAQYGASWWIAGTPCQDFSVAGLRAGLEGDRGNLTMLLVELMNEHDDCVGHKGAKINLLWENVPGVFSDRGNAFGCFLAALAGEASPLEPPGGKWTDAGYVLGPRRSICWRVLDAQYFGLAQRRRRVFLAACPRDGADPRKILFEFEGLRRDTAPRRETGTDVASPVKASFGGRGFPQDPEAAAGGYFQPITQALPGRLGSGGPDDNKAQGGFYVAAFGGECSQERDIATAIKGANHHQDFASETFIAQTLRAEGFDASEDGTGRANLISVAFHGSQDPDVSGDVTHPCGRNNGLETCVAAIAIRGREGGCNIEMRADGTANALRTPNGGRGGEGCGAVLSQAAVRRLTPRECERLQGFPDDYTLIEYRGKPAADGPRYKALGNSKAVPVVRWILNRITHHILAADQTSEQS